MQGVILNFYYAKAKESCIMGKAICRERRNERYQHIYIKMDCNYFNAD